MNSNSPRLPETEAVDIIYRRGIRFPTILFISSIGVLIFSILINFPVEKNLEKFINTQMAKNRACPTHFTTFGLGYFLPRLIFQGFSADGKCFNSPGKTLHFDEVVLSLSFPSFYPIGIKTHVKASSGGSIIHAYPRFALFGEHEVQLTNTKIEGAFLSQLTPYPNLLRGLFTLQGHLKLGKRSLNEGDTTVTSDNLEIPAQNIAGIDLPPLKIGKLELALSFSKKGGILLKALRLGSVSSSVQAELTGTIKLNQANPEFSPLDLTGKLRLSEEVLQSIPLLNLLLKSKPKQDDFYFIKLEGTLGAPKPLFVNPA